jgi:hypothetical protein
VRIFGVSRQKPGFPLQSFLPQGGKKGFPLQSFAPNGLILLLSLLTLVNQSVSYRSTFSSVRLFMNFKDA